MAISRKTYADAGMELHMMVTPFSTKLSQVRLSWGRIGGGESLQADLDVGDAPFDVDGTQQFDTVDQGYDAGNNGTVGKSDNLCKSRRGQSHKRPVKKMANTPIFLFMGSCNCTMAGIGRTRIKRSSATLDTACTTPKVKALRQDMRTEKFHLCPAGGAHRVETTGKLTTIYTTKPNAMPHLIITRMSFLSANMR